MSDSEIKAITYEVGGWVWGTLQGGFNEQQTVSQIIVDAAIGMIPVVGDVTAGRDLIAVSLRLIDQPDKRKEVMEWVTLVLFLFALVPVAGGVIKGIGQLAIKAGAEAAGNVKLLREAVELANRLGTGDAVKFIKALDLESHTAELLGHFRKLTQQFDDLVNAIVSRMGGVLSDSNVARLRSLQKGFRTLKVEGEKMIPEAVKELNARLKQVQKQIYEGQWHDVPSSLVSNTREAEARLVERIADDGKAVKAWEASQLPYPANSTKKFRPPPDWPPMHSPSVVATFSGPIRAVELKPGTRIFRVVTETSDTAGAYWTYALPRNGRSWREDCAVLDSWSHNGYFVEYVVPEEGLKAFEGSVASQVANDATKPDFGQVLPGGNIQLYINFRAPAHKAAAEQVLALERVPTNWTDFMGLHIPDKQVTVQQLGEFEIASKKPAAAATSATGARAARATTRGPSNSGTQPRPSP